MLYKITLSAEDYLQFQLYTASQSPRIRKKRRQGWIITVLIPGLLAALCLSWGNYFLFYYFLGFVALAAFFYPYYSRHRYHKHYQNYIAEHYQGRIGIVQTLDFSPEQIESKSTIGEGLIHTREIKRITEIADYFFLRLSTDESLIIPKSQLSDLVTIKDYLRDLSQRNSCEYLEELNWKWT